MDFELLDWLEARACDHQKQIITSEELLICAFMALQMHQFQKQFSNRATRFSPRPEWPHDREKLLETTHDFSLFKNWLKERHFRLVIANAQTAMRKILDGEWSAKILFHIPTPLEVLEYQCQGLRVVTLLWKKDRVLQPVLEKDNALHFMLHDLEHLYKFEFDPALKIQQIDFARKIKAAFESGHYLDFLKDPDFQKKFDYLASDMNTHPLHGLKFMKAMYLEYLLRQKTDQTTILNPVEEQKYDDLMRELSQMWNFSKESTEALIRLNKAPLAPQEIESLVAEFN